MHQLLPIKPCQRWWPRNLSPRWIRFWRPWRRLLLRWQECILQVEVHGLEHLQEAISADHGVLLTPNHFTYADSLILYEAAERIDRALYFMTAGQILETSSWLKRTVLRQHGSFSLDREGEPLRGFRQAVDILCSERHPLVIFPEGEMFHFADRIAPFNEGAAAVAIRAAAQSSRSVVCVPCALQYFDLDVPTTQHISLTERLEQICFGRASTNTEALTQRIQRIVEAIVARLEMDHVGHTMCEPLPDRLKGLMETLLARLEKSWVPSGEPASIPGRLKRVQKAILRKTAESPLHSPLRQQGERDLAAAMCVTQLFCYPGDYFTTEMDARRIAEILDKLEEDLLGIPIAKARCERRAVITFGGPIAVPRAPATREASATLTRLLEQKVQTLLDGHCPQSSTETALRDSTALAVANPP
jgi:1-acyl-sn-glycerol-3-phosphate acyltransferase